MTDVTTSFRQHGITAVRALGAAALLGSTYTATAATLVDKQTTQFGRENCCGGWSDSGVMCGIVAYPMRLCDGQEDCQPGPVGSCCAAACDTGS